MTAPTLTVVIPAYNSREDIESTISAVVAATTGGPFRADVVLVDDGSTDDTAAVALRACDGRLPISVLSQSNRGRFEARRAGLDAATGDWVLLLDSRVAIDRGALRFVADRIAQGKEVWNGHVRVLDGGNPLGVFWRLLAEIAWADYFDNPRETSYGLDDFDRYPKGTGCFLARRSVLRDAVEAFSSSYDDVTSANDDTRLIRWVAERQAINLSPQFACSYRPRTALRSFVRHSVHRGVVFLDGHGHPRSRFFPVIATFYPASLALAIAALRRPAVLPASAVGVSAAAAAIALARRRSPFEIASLGVAAPVYAAGHGLGMWKGLALLIRSRVDRT